MFQFCGEINSIINLKQVKSVLREYSVDEIYASSLKLLKFFFISATVFFTRDLR